MAWHPVDVSPDFQSTCVRLADADLLIVHLEGVWFAVEDRCSHADCSFSADGEIDGTTVICNCHGSEFDLRTGEPLVGPAFEPIRTFPVRLRDGRLEVEL